MKSPNMENLKELKLLAEMFDTDKIITNDQIEQVLTGVLGLLVRFKKENSELNKETKETVESILSSIYAEHDRILKSVENSTQNVKSEATEAIKNAIQEILTYKAKDGNNGKDADEEVIVEKVLGKIVLPEYKETVLDSGEQIVDKINALDLSPDNQIDASHIKNLPEPRMIGGGSTARNLYQLGDVSVSGLANNDVLKYNSTTNLWENGGGGGGSGTVTSVAATVPTGLTISGSPITAAGTLAIALDTGYVIPLQTTLDGKANTALSNLASVAINTSLISDTDNTDDLGSALIGWRTGYFSTSILTPTVTADTSAGLLLESANGTDVGLLGAGNTANVTWYGSHNFNTATQDTIAAFTGAGKTLGSLATATYPSLTELARIKGLTSAVQTQLDAKVDDGAVTTSGLTMATARILGRTTAATGAIEELTAGSSLSLSAGSLNTIQDIRTTANPRFATIELGAATDTTLSRVSAGVIAVEGVTVATASNTLTLSGKTLTAPKFADLGFIADANGNEMIIFDTVASAVNEVTLANAATGANPKLSATGGDTNIGIDLQTKGTGVVNILGNSTQAGEVRISEDTDNGTNYTGFKAPATLAGNVVYTLPSADGSSGQLLSTNGSGTLSWATGGSSSFSGAKAYRTTDVSLTASTWATIDLDNETYDTDTYHDNSTNPSRITIPATGKYRFTANTELTANKTHGVRLLLNGSAIEGGSQTAGNAGFAEGDSLSWENTFTSGDYVQMQVITANTATSCTFAALSVQRLE